MEWCQYFQESSPAENMVDVGHVQTRDPSRTCTARVFTESHLTLPCSRSSLWFFILPVSSSEFRSVDVSKAKGWRKISLRI
jgi:hypothetical protein